MSVSSPFDPYAAQTRAEWRNRIAGWRAAPAESAFHGLGLLGALAVAGWVLLASWPSLRAALQGMLAHPALAILVWMLLVGADQFVLRRTQQQRWAEDWFAAQPIAPAQRLGRRGKEALRRLLTLWVQAMVLLVAADREAAVVPATVSAMLAGLGGHWLADRRGAPRSPRSARYSMLNAAGRGTLWRWQWIVAGRALTPGALAACMPVILLIPRGPALLLGVAITLVVVLATASAWLRMSALIVDAQRWLDEQPLRGTDWLPGAVVLPLLLLGAALLLAGAALWLGGAAPPLLLALALLGALALLHLGAILAARRTPRRILMLSAVHQLLLLAGLQAAPPLLPLQWALQFGWLLQRGWRA